MGTGLDPHWLRETVARALDEDLGGDPGRDVTTESTVEPGETGVAHLMARADGVVAGLGATDEVLGQVATRLHVASPLVELNVADGDRVHAGEVLGVISGPVQVILIA